MHGEHKEGQKKHQGRGTLIVVPVSVTTAAVIMVCHSPALPLAAHTPCLQSRGIICMIYFCSFCIMITSGGMQYMIVLSASLQMQQRVSSIAESEGNLNRGMAHTS